MTPPVDQPTTPRVRRGPPHLTQARLRELFDYDAANGGLVWRVRPNHGGRMAPGCRAGTATPAGYMRVMVGGRFYFIHRLVWLWHRGETPARLDHINRSRADNRIENLRPATSTQNMWNAGKYAAARSRWKGVGLQNQVNLWQARIRANGKTRSLGLHKEQEDAAMAYNAAALELFGEFAVLNAAEQTCPLLRG